MKSSLHRPWLAVLAAGLFAAGLFGGGLFGESAAWAQEKPESLPEGTQITALVANPPAISLKSKYEYAQLVITAQTATGEEIDVTRLAAASAAAPQVSGGLVEVSPTGVVRPQADGQGEAVFTLGGQSVKVPVQVAGFASEYPVNYIRDVTPVMSKLGCNAGTCHGSKEGKNGFKLSLRGYDPIYDTRALADDHSARRINRAAPDNSLMLLKATGAVPHVGGQLTKPGEPYYDIIRAWIADGVKLDLATPRVTKIDITPTNPVVLVIGSKQQMRILATYADGAVRDVTREAFIETGNQDVAKVDSSGLVTVLRRGEAPILARYEGAYVATTLTAMGQREGFVWQEMPANNQVDVFTAAKMKRMKTLPSELCSDDEFIRRVSIDLTGLPPDSAAVRAFLADTRETKVKRDELIDKLIGNSDYIEHWSNKWADLLQVNGKFLGPEGAASFRNWIKQAVAENMPYDRFAYAILTASGSNKENPAAGYYKILRTPEDTMENTTHLFLAVRFNCNKCHDHPFERWTQDQYYHLAAYFAQVGLKADPASAGKNIGGTAVEGAKPLFEVVFDTGAGEVTHDRTGQVTPPAFPYEHPYQADPQASRREQLARWITTPDNQYFAKSYVNRLWGYLLGAGIIEPIDDIRAGNPPTNPELLDWLTKQFIDSGFNTQEILRTICKSRTYQLSVATNKWNVDDRINYSHAMARRLPAEVLYDAVHRVTGSQTRLPGMPAGMRAAQLPDADANLPSAFLDQFGRPARESSCECERSSGMMLGPVMALVNGPTIAEAISDPANGITKLVSEEKDDAKLIEEIFFRILNRAPSSAERTAGIEALSGLEKDHVTLVAALKEYEAGVPARQAEWEKQKQAAIAAANAALAAHEAGIPARMAEWEKQQLTASGWKVLNVTKLGSTNGAELTKEEDDVDLIAKNENGAVFVTGKNGKGQYQVTTETDLVGITGIRLEVLADERLPSKGPGRSPNGNFVLNELGLMAAPKATPDKLARVILQNAKADFSQEGFEVAKSVDGDLGQGWAVHPQTGQSHAAIFETEVNIANEGGSVLSFAFEFYYADGVHSIGRFRLLATTSPRPLQLQGLPANIAAIVAKPVDQRDAAQNAELLAFFKATDDKLAELQLAAKSAAEQQPSADNTLVQLQAAVAESTKQMGNQRLIGAQDLVWALINSPSFLFNR